MKRPTRAGGRGQDSSARRLTLLGLTTVPGEPDFPEVPARLREPHFPGGAVHRSPREARRSGPGGACALCHPGREPQARISHTDRRRGRGRGDRAGSPARSGLRDYRSLRAGPAAAAARAIGGRRGRGRAGLRRRAAHASSRGDQVGEVGQGLVQMVRRERRESDVLAERAGDRRPVVGQGDPGSGRSGRGQVIAPDPATKSQVAVASPSLASWPGSQEMACGGSNTCTRLAIR